MHRSNILSENLNADIELKKRLTFAETVFKSSLSIAYKEEHILIWLLKEILEVKQEEKNMLIKSFCACVESEKMTFMPGSAVRTKAKTIISKCLTKILKQSHNIHNNIFNAVIKILKKFFLHYKSHPKQFVKILCELLNQTVTSSQYNELLSLTSDIFKGGIVHETFVMHLLKKDFSVFFNHSNDDKDNAFIQFIQKMFFKKDIVNQFQITLHALCSGHETTSCVPVVKALINFLHCTFIAEININLKVKVFYKVFQSFVKSISNEDSSMILEFFLLMCHLLGLEQKVLIQQNSKSDPDVIINENCFKEVFNIPSTTSSETSYVIVKSLINVLSTSSPDLNTGLLDSTYLHWFQTFLIMTSNTELSNVHLDFFCSCADLSVTIFEKNFTKLFSRILMQPKETFEEYDFNKSLHNFMENVLQIYIKLQRIEKFFLKLLQCIRNSRTTLAQKDVFSNSFINEFSNTITLLPSSQSISLMDELLSTLNSDCVKPLEENSESVNILLIQTIGSLFCAFLRGVRILNHMTPQGIVKLFMDKMQELKNLLGRFGKALLVRIHDRDIVQPFLNLSFYWSEIELMIMYYFEHHEEQLTNKDISPTDLSTVHSYLSGEEWNVLAERVSNFGAVKCYQLFLKLILQKLRTLQLKKCYSLINGEATSKYILTQLTSELYKHNIIEELTPEDISFLLNYLSHGQSRLLLEKLYNHPLEQEKSGRLIDWISNSILLENRNFITLSLVVTLQKVGSKLNSVSKHNGAPGIPLSGLMLNLIDENCNVVEDDFLKFVEDLNQLLRNNFHIPKNNSKLVEMKIFIDVFKSLPFLYMPYEVRSLALTAATFLAVTFTNTEEFLKPLLILIYDLMLQTCKTSLFKCFSPGLCIRWLLQLDNLPEKIKIVKQRMVKLLLKSATNMYDASEDLKQLIKFMKKEKSENNSKALENQIVLYQDLGKSWVKTKKRSAKNDEIVSYRNALSKRIRRELEKQNELETPTADTEILVAAYDVELTRVVKSKKEEDILGLLKLNFEKFFDIAASEVRKGSKKEGYVTFLTTILLHMPYIKKHLKKTALTKIWNALKTHGKVNWKLFYNAADDSEFEFFLLDLLKVWRVFAKGKSDKVDLGTYFEIWREFYNKKEENRNKLYEKYLKRLFAQFSAGAYSLEHFTPNQIIELFNFFKFCISTTELVMTSIMLDVSLDIMYNYEYRDNMSSMEFRKVFDACVTSASWLLTARSERIKDKIQNVFQLFSKLLDALVKRGSVTTDLEEEDLLALSSCSHSLEKWTSKMVGLDKDFARVAVYFIAVLVSSFVKVNIYPVVKAPLVNCIYNFLSISDSHNIAYLVRVLNPGSQQVFSGIYETYKKYYKFTGRV